MSYRIEKKTTGDVWIVDYTTSEVIKTLSATASLLLSAKTKTGGIYVTDSAGRDFWIDKDLVIETKIDPAAAVAFTGTTKQLYELLELSFFYNILNQVGAGGLVETNIIAPAVNTTLSTSNYIVVCAASILIKLPASPAIGQVYKIYANNNTINVSPTTGAHTIIGKTSVDFQRYTSIIIQYVSTNNWLII